MTVMSAIAGMGVDALINLTGGTFTSEPFYPDGAQAFYSLNVDGTVTIVDDDGDTAPPWCVPGTLSSFYEVFATLLSGVLTTGTTGAWTSAGGQAWDVQVPAFNHSTKAASVQLEIRKVGTVTILDTVTINLSAHPV